LDAAAGLDPRDLVRGFLLTPPEFAPGSVFAYSQPCTFTVGAIVSRVSGVSLTEFLRLRLFDPLGIATVGWQRDVSGRELGYSGLHTTTAALASLGQLYLQGGRWDDRQLLPSAWVAEATRSQVSTAAEQNPDWQQGYGFQFWRSRHGYRGDGAFGQFCLVLPELDAVLALTSQTPDMQSVLDLVWAHVLPALNGVGDPAADAALVERLVALRIPPAEGGGSLTGRAPTAAGRTFAAAGGNDQPSLTEVTLSGTDGGWQLELSEGDARLVVPMGVGEWMVSDALAASGAWTGDDLHVDVLFVETPHRLQLVCRASGEFAARWVTAPLWDSRLADLRMPE
ncbi:MAG: serine hydrolase, partial [Nakamurella sp.]